MTSPQQAKVWFITGTSRGFGRELVRQVLEQGDLVVATSRDPKQVQAQFPDNDRLLAMSLDLLDEAQIRRLVQDVATRLGRIDVLVNNAGHGMLGAIEEVGKAGQGS